MRFGFTILYVEDVERSLDFYERALGLERRFLHESGDYGELETGATALAFATHELAASNLPGVYTGAMENGEPSALRGVLRHRGRRGRLRARRRGGRGRVTEPATKPWGQDVAYVRDPDGNLIELASPVE